MPAGTMLLAKRVVFLRRPETLGKQSRANFYPPLQAGDSVPLPIVLPSAAVLLFRTGVPPLSRRWIIGATFLAITAGTVRAADLPVKAPVAVAAPWSWTGFYIGGNIGGALEYSRLQDRFGTVSFGDSVTTTAFIAGGQIGGNYQIGNVVLGAEADLNWVTSRGDET